MTLGQAALKWLLAEPRVVTTLPNIYDDEQLAEFADGERHAGSVARRIWRAWPSWTRRNFGVDEDADVVQGNDDARRRGGARLARPRMIHLWHDLPPGRTRRKRSPPSSRFRSAAATSTSSTRRPA